MDAKQLLREVELDLGLRSNFEAELRKTLTAFRQNPKPGAYEISVKLQLDPLQGWPER